MTGADQLDQQFPIEVEAVALEGEAGEAFAPEDFVHREGVAQRQSQRRVDQRGEEPVPRIQGEGVEYLLVKLADEPALAAVPRPEHETVGAGAQGGEQGFIVARIVFQVGILDQNDVAGDVLETMADRMPLAPGPLLQHDLHMGKMRKAEHNFAAAIG